MQASKLQYELECVQRPGAEVLINGVPIGDVEFVFDPNSNTTNLVNKVEELETPEEEIETEDISLPPVDEEVAEPETKVESTNSGFFGFAK